MTNLRVLTLLMTVAAMTACTDVDLCPENYHPHRAKVKFVYNWNEYENDEGRPDSMYVIANRVINFWKMTAAINTKKGDQDEGKGRYVYNELPKMEETETTETQTPEEEETENVEVADDSTPTDPTSPTKTKASAEAPEEIYKEETFDIQVGEYKFYTFTATDQMDTKNVDKFISSDDNNMTNEGFALEYNTYNKEDKAFISAVDKMMEPLTAMGFKGWNDFNPYSKYMLPASKPLFIDSVNITPIMQNGLTTITFDPKPATQTVTINVKVRKVFSDGCAFKVEGIIGEVSGVPHTINLSNGYVDIETTNKMMFPFTVVNVEEDTEDNDFLLYTAKINVPGIVKSATDEATIGPGLLQAFVYCTVFKDGTAIKRKKIQGILNMYDELTRENMIEITEDGNHARLVGREHTIDIGAEIIIDGADSIPNEEEGIKGWIETDKDIDLEL